MPESRQMRVSLGILAHNEERRIGSMLESLFMQSVFRKVERDRLGIAHLELVCVPNGCTDRTALIAADVFRARPIEQEVSYKIEIRTQPGKSGAWNFFVHEVSDANAQYLILLDADISFHSEDVLESLVKTLERDPRAVVATDQPIKAIKNKAKLSMRDRASLYASAQVSGENSITGQLYCGRREELRKVFMPPSLPVEDGFLAAMIFTDGFTVQQRPGSIVKVHDAIHYYETHVDLRGFLRHERRIIVGSVINSLLFGLLWKVGKEGHVGRFIKHENDRDPLWLDRFIEKEISERSFWIVPPHFLLKRLDPLRGQSMMGLIKRAPIALVSAVLTSLACIQANLTLKGKRANYFW